MPQRESNASHLAHIRLYGHLVSQIPEDGIFSNLTHYFINSPGAGRNRAQIGLTSYSNFALAGMGGSLC